MGAAGERILNLHRGATARVAELAAAALREAAGA
jgi:hypothetical protein